MRHLLVALAATLIAISPVYSQADPKKDPPKEKEPKAKLKIGDKAPTMKISNWYQGTEIKDFSKDNVYVLEFWATWCGPCIRAMPHLVDLQNEFKDKGLVVVGVTTQGEGNTKDKVETFIKKNAKKVTYLMAFCEDDVTNKNYMDAAGQNGIPCSFVVGKDGNIAFIGHPSNLDDVLPKVLDGTWKGQADADALEKVNEELEKIFEQGGKDAVAGLAALAEFEKKHPTKGNQADFMIQKTIFMAKAGKFDDLKAQAEVMMAVSEKKKKADPAVYAALILAEKTFNPDKKHIETAVKAMEIALKYETTDPQLFVAAIDVYLAAGNKDKAAEMGTKAIAASDDPKEKEQIEKFVKMKLGGDKK